MNKILIVYILIYIAFSTLGVIDSISQSYPSWKLAIELITRIFALLILLLYLTDVRLLSLTALWKASPMILIIGAIHSWYYDFFVSVNPEYTLKIILIATVISAVIQLPSWYISYIYAFKTN